MASIRRDLPLNEARAAMKEHFNTYSGSNYTEGWSKLWEDGSFLPWDRGRPSPALVDTLENHQSLIGRALVDGRRKKALVPGCGRGVDVLLLESFGYEAVGLEVSECAVKAANEYANDFGNDYPVRDREMGKGSKLFVHGDFYKDDFLKEAGLKDGERFDLIYDYTFFCAMNPSMRPAWAKRMSDLLADSASANLICLEFPIDKPANAGGPPFGSPSKAYIEHLSHPGEDLPYGPDGAPKLSLQPASEIGLERVGYWQPADTHQIGKDEAGNVKDNISVWRHR